MEEICCIVSCHTIAAHTLTACRHRGSVQKQSTASGLTLQLTVMDSLERSNSMEDKFCIVSCHTIVACTLIAYRHKIGIA